MENVDISTFLSCIMDMLKENEKLGSPAIFQLVCFNRPEGDFLKTASYHTVRIFYFVYKFVAFGIAIMTALRNINLVLV